MTPLIALLSSAVPVVVALVLGDDSSRSPGSRSCVAIVGSVLIGVERRVSARELKPRTLVFAVISGVGFGFATVALDAAPADAGMVPVFLDTTVGLRAAPRPSSGLARTLPVMQRVVAVLDAHPTEPAPRPTDAAHLHLAEPRPTAPPRQRPAPRGSPSTVRAGRPPTAAPACSPAPPASSSAAPTCCS